MDSRFVISKPPTKENCVMSKFELDIDTKIDEILDLLSLVKSSAIRDSSTYCEVIDLCIAICERQSTRLFEHLIDDDYTRNCKESSEILCEEQMNMKLDDYEEC